MAAPVVLTAAKKRRKATKGRKPYRGRYVIRRRHVPRKLEYRDYDTWSRDFDTALHGILRNPAHSKDTPDEIAERAASIADAIRKVQAPRRPKGYDRW